MAFTSWQTDWQKAQEFDTAWWNHQPPQVRKLKDIEDPGMRSAAAKVLEGQGYKIDEEIVIWLWSPYVKYSMAGLSVDPNDYPPYNPPVIPPPPPPGPVVPLGEPLSGFYQVYNVPGGENPTKVGMQVSVDGRTYQLVQTGFYTISGPILAWKLM